MMVGLSTFGMGSSVEVLLGIRNRVVGVLNSGKESFPTPGAAANLASSSLATENAATVSVYPGAPGGILRSIFESLFTSASVSSAVVTKLLAGLHGLPATTSDHVGLPVLSLPIL